MKEYYLKMTNEELKDYIVNKGEYFRIKNIDTFRDGGTVVLITTDRTFYIHQNSEIFYFNTPSTVKNTVTDPLLIQFLLYSIEKYIKECEDNIIRHKSMLTKLKNNV